MTDPYGGFPQYEPPAGGSPTPSGVPWGDPKSVQVSRDGVSIAALVCSLTCCAAPIGVGLSIAGIVRTRDGMRSGRWAAITGLILGAVLIIGFVGFATLLGVRALYVEETQVGQCINFDVFDGLAEGECGEPHDAEVIWVSSLDANLVDQWRNHSSEDFCAARALTPEHLTALEGDDYTVEIFIESFDEPEEGDWILCYVERADGNQMEGRLTETGGEPARTDPEYTSDQSIEVIDLVTGDCFDDTVLGDLESAQHGAADGQLHRVPCNGPHQFEVYGKFVITGDKFPGDAAIIKETDRCLPLFKDYVGRSFSRSTYESYSYHPSEDSWSMGDRTVTCVLSDPDVRERTRSAKNTQI
ncbi:DUF4190 domain-containing protein [Nocardioides sp. WS12]|uniref:DUF4190 domain-containing protein n=1 Tax=Nocardioides sp. WS12 TaxID=2486272 RepID=UPI0015FD8C6D|nr:DUF4190 domain-containing protein [Nocardioides sp. WS12]